MKHLKWLSARLLTVTLLTTGMCASVAHAAKPATPSVDEIASIHQRFSAPKVSETPDFQKHVVPLMGRLGCNGRACHGSFQGQGGFRLSLFGYDFKMDHESLTTGDEPRVDLKDPYLSLMIMKPTNENPHKGGQRMTEDSWEALVFLRWIEGGAKGTPEPTKLEKLEVTPKEILFNANGETVQMRAVAHWADGTQEDVTRLCRFQINDDQIGDINENGLLVSKEPGDSHVVVSYDRAVVPIPVIQPVSEQRGDKYPQVATRTKVDELVVEKLRKLGIVPSEVCSDGEFLRRVSLDLCGSLPTASEAEQFLADSSTDKRARKVAELLNRPTYAAWWTTKLSDYTGNNDYELRNTIPVRTSLSQDWYDWIYKRVADNTPYDELAAGIILANGREAGESFNDYSKNMTKIFGSKDENHNFADRESMQFFWARRNLRQPEEKALAFAYSFMGIRIQCAQCHKHPFDQWSQDDYKEFTKFFTNITFGIHRESRDQYNKMMDDLNIKSTNGGERRRAMQKALEEGKVIPFMELHATPVVVRRNNNNNNRRERYVTADGTAKLLGGDVIDLTKVDDSRKPLMDWLRAKDNPFFAKAFVNRVWENYFNQGIVSPADDHSLANPPSNKPLLDYLTQGFIDNNFNMKWLHQEIILSDAYQRSWKPNSTNRLDQKNFSHAIPRRMPAEVAYDALKTATAADATASNMQQEIEKRAICIPGSNGNRASRGYGDAGYALTIFGRSVRESNCDCDRSSEPSLLQTVYLRNDDDLHSMIGDKRSGWVKQILSEVAPNLKVRGTPSSADRQRYFKTAKTFRDRITKLRKQGNTKGAQALEKKLAELRKQFDPASEKPKPEKIELSSKELDKVINSAYLRTLTRYPTETEQERSREYLASADDFVKGVEDLLWALLNTKEFIVNH